MLLHSQRCWRLPSRRTFFTSLAQPQSYVISRRLALPAATVYRVVADVHRYHEFIPHCTTLFVNRRDAAGEPLEAGLLVGWQEWDERFVCALACVAPSQVVASSLSDLLFEHLRCVWDIREVTKGTSSITVSLDYQFKNPLYNAASGVFASTVTELMVDAFGKRASAMARQKDSGSGWL